jgi:hypothetical protein
VAIAHVVENTKLETGDSGKALRSGVGMVAQVVGTGTIGCMIIGFVAFWANSTFAPLGAMSDALTAAQTLLPSINPAGVELLLGAALLGGLVCALFEALSQYTQLPVPKMLVLGLMAGGFLTVPGVMSSLSALGGAGVDVMVVGAGSAVTATTMVLCLGLPVPLITVLCVFAALTVLGCIWGLLRAALSKTEAEA